MGRNREGRGSDRRRGEEGEGVRMGKGGGGKEEMERGETRKENRQFTVICM